MAINRELVQIVEIDVDQCSLTYGSSPCTATLDANSVRKCFNGWNTCQDKTNYDKSTLTLRFVNARSNLPITATYLPTLESVSAFSSSVNISGSNPKLGLLGKRGKVTVTLNDFPYHDRLTDKYALERASGAAQHSGVGYDPESLGTFWTKFKKRNPNYAGRALRVINTWITTENSISYLLKEDGDYLLNEDGGRITLSYSFLNGFPSSGTQTRHFIITEIKGPGDNNKVTIEAKDVLTLAEKKSAVAPAPSNGALEEGISDSTSTFTLTPEAVGSQYPTSGYAVIGSEVVSYTRASDVITLTGRGLEGTTAESHSADATFQEALSYSDKYLYEVLDDLLGTYTDIDAAFIPSADYQTEVERWAPTIKINTLITKSTPVADLLGELSVLGASIWWDDVDQEVKLRMNHPLDVTETARAVTDDNAILGITQEDRDEERITQVHYYSVQSDPTGDIKDKSNYNRILVTVDTDAQREENFGDTRVREVFCRWLNTGNDTIARNASLRLLQRFVRAPEYFTVKLDNKDIDLGLTDVLDVTSRVVTDVTGAPAIKKLQIAQKSESKQGHEVQVVCQSYEFDDFYGFIMENTANDYDSATDLEKEEGWYLIAEGDETFDDGREAYRII